MLPSANHAAAVEIGEERPQPSDLDPRFTFENFVVGKPNELAHAAARRKEAAAEARMRFARIKSGVIGPIFDEVVARLAAEGFFGETVNEQNDASGPISLNVNLSEDEGFSRQGSLQVRFNPDKYTCEFGTSTMAKASSTSQIVLDAIHRKIDEMTEELVRETAEQFVLDLIAGKLFR
jgi:hypothetical protein